MKRNAFLIAFAIVLWMPPGIRAQTASAPAAVSAAAAKSERFYRTELYMGRSVQGGGTVSDEAWEKFLNDVVTPRFPDGFTGLSGRGQWREASGTIAKESSQVLVFLYKKADRKAARAKIDEIKREYARQFRQEAVMRIDFANSVLVTF